MIPFVSSGTSEGPQMQGNFDILNTIFYCSSAGLKCPPLIVDPNKNLLEIAKGRGLDTLLVPADTFFSSPSACQYNKYLFCHSTHYFPDRRTTFEKAFAGIPVGSVLLIIDEDSTRLAMPLFSKALEMQNLQQKSGNLSLDLSDAGFVIEQQEGKMPFSYTKEEWYRKLRGRYRAVLEVFTDEEIEAGIAELERSTLKDTDVVQFENTYRYFLAVKEN